MNGGTNGYKRQHGITVKQENALDLLIQGATHQEAAEAAGVARATVSKWMALDVYFQAELNRRRREIWGTSLDRLRSMVPRALDALDMSSGTARTAGA
jgi:hypothetical protein